MTKFQVLKYNQAIMARLGLYSYRLSEPSNEFFYSLASYYFLLAGEILSVLTSALFVYKHWPQFNIVSQPCLIIIGSSVCFGIFLSVGLKLKSITTLHLKLQEITDEGELNFVLKKKTSKFSMIFDFCKN